MKKLDFDEIFSFEKVQNNEQEAFILYGVGVHSEFVYQKLKEAHIIPAEVCDTYKIGNTFHDYTVRSIQDVAKKYGKIKIYIASPNFYDEIKAYLLGFVSEDVILPQYGYTCFGFSDFVKKHSGEFETVYNLLEDEKSQEIFTQVLKGRSSMDFNIFKNIRVGRQYFVEELIQLSEQEVFVDCGAFTGDTLEDFICNTKNKFKRIYCFEPSDDTYNELFKVWVKYNKDERVVLEKSGLYFETTRVGFNDNHLSAGNAINTESTDLIDVVAIDEFIDEPVTFIKMDIEGAELDALHGAKETILKYKPKLAISIYHRYEDYIEIPKFINDLNLGYKFYVRHHTDCQGDTILYAL